MSPLLTNNEGLALFAGKGPNERKESGFAAEQAQKYKSAKIRVDLSLLHSFIFVISSLFNVPIYLKKTFALLFLYINAHDFFSF